MDFIKRPYTTKCFFGQGGTLEATIRWFVVPPGTPTIGVPSIVCDLDWEDEPYAYGDVGEVWGEPRKYDRRPAPSVAGIDHVCGTLEDFEKGASEPSPVPVGYAPDGLPFCCRPGGGFNWGGFVQPYSLGILGWYGDADPPMAQINLVTIGPPTAWFDAELVHVARAVVTNPDSAARWRLPVATVAGTYDIDYQDDTPFGLGVWRVLDSSGVVTASGFLPNGAPSASVALAVGDTLFIQGYDSTFFGFTRYYRFTVHSP